ncbi:MAG: transcription antitermination factor NusB [Defluviitaleaceae bacterium]|nr:transcription antitermination factor NusB [Defluviitaleaceae bacterium]
MSRHTARIHAFNLIFQFPFHLEWDKALVVEATEQYLANLQNLQDLLQGLSPDEEEYNFISGEVLGTYTNLSQIDALINQRLKDWDFNRLAKADLALLRLAIYEILFSSDISEATAINEAVELAKVYGTDDSSAFINGVLGQVVRNG